MNRLKFSLVGMIIFVLLVDSNDNICFLYLSISSLVYWRFQPIAKFIIKMYVNSVTEHIERIPPSNY